MPETAQSVEQVADRMEAAGQVPLGSSLSAFHLTAGDCGGCGLEMRGVQAMLGQLAQAGLQFTTNPRQADVLLVTGVITHALHDAVLAAWDAMPDPKWLVAVGDCAVDGGLFRGSYPVRGGIGEVLPVDVAVRGCPPSPAQIMDALRVLAQANQLGSRFS